MRFNFYNESINPELLTITIITRLQNKINLILLVPIPGLGVFSIRTILIPGKLK